jgi:Co/Zn/Cd efflux system component
MSETSPHGRHDHVFLGETHGRSERNVCATIALTAAMMVVEIAGGAIFGSIALVADGFHMMTHVGALLLAALAYTLARRHARDARFTFGAGKFGDLAGFSSALILAMVALGVGYESAARLFAPTPIDFAEAIPIAALGLIVNVASAWLLSRGGGHHHHHHGDEGTHHHHAHDETRRLEIGGATYALSVFEDGVPPRFRLAGPQGAAATCHVETARGDGSRCASAAAISNRSMKSPSRMNSRSS